MQYKNFLIRAAKDDDYLELSEVIMSCFAEYPNCVMDVDGEMPELRGMASYSQKTGGKFWVAERDGRVIACVGVGPASSNDGVELKKLYVHRSARRTGLARRLSNLVEDEAHARNAPWIELWSDTKFQDAHAFYRALGYVGGTLTRELHDLSNTVEYYFRKEL